MASQLKISDHIEGAEIYNGGSSCKQKSQELLSSMNLPKGILPLNDMTELGYNKTTGFVWIKSKNKVQHRFGAIGRTVSYETEVTGFIENRRMRKISGVKSKELLIWITISEIFVNDQDPSKISFATPSGLSRIFPVSAFEED